MEQVIYLMGLAIAGFLFLLLLLKKGKETADYLLMIWMGVTAVQSLLQYLQTSGFNYAYPHTLGLNLPLPALSGTLLYYYTLSITRQRVFDPAIRLIHLAPFVLLVILALPFYLLSGNEKILVFQNDGQGFEWYLIIQFFLIAASGFFYALLSILEVRKYRKTIVHFKSNTDKIMLAWLEYLAIGLGLLWVLVLFFDEQTIYMGVIGFVLFIGIFGINQTAVFQSRMQKDVAQTPVEEEVENALSDEPLRYARSGLTPAYIAAIMHDLENLMLAQAPYKKADLTLGELAELLQVSPAQLSQAINSEWGESFYDYINTYRIDAFLKIAQLPENKKFTFLALAFSCGFNSKTTFNKYFKIKTGKTPSAYFKAQTV
jgi:AraC-like DNA-binding protein